MKKQTEDFAIFVMFCTLLFLLGGVLGYVVHIAIGG